MQTNTENYLNKLLQVSKQIWHQMTSFSSSSQLMFQPDEDIIQFNETPWWRTKFEELDVPINTTEIIRACKRLNLGKSTCPDFLINKFFKYGSESNQFI